MTAKLSDPAGLARLAALLAPAIRRTKKAPVPLETDAQEVEHGSARTPTLAA